MFIGFFVQNYLKGGLDTFLIELINNWPNKNDDIVLFCNKSHPGLDNLNKLILKKKFKIIEYNFGQNHNFYKNKSKILKLLISVYLIIYNLFYFRKLLKNYKFNKFIVVNGGYPGGHASIYASIVYGIYKNIDSKPILNVHSIVGDPIKRDIGNLHYRILNKCFDFLISHSISKIITCSNAVNNSFENRKIFKKINKITIYNGITEQVVSKKKNKEKEIKNIVILATYEPIKGHEIAIDAIHELIKKRKDIKLLNYGDSDFSHKSHINFLRKKVRGLNLERFVEFNEFTKETSKIYENSFLILIPTQAEGFGLTAIEAMMHSLPVIGFNSGGLKEVIENNVNGFLIKKRDANELAEKINFLIENKDIYRKFCYNSYKIYIKNFNSNNMANKYYEQIKL